MHYSENPDHVRVSFFKKSGKWYTDEKIIWTGAYTNCPIHDSFKKSLRDHFKDSPDRLSEMDAICLEPYHEHAHPIQIKNGEWNV